MAKPGSRPTYAWWIILCLVGLDYFSSLAYLPSIAMTFAEDVRDLAPIAGAGVVFVTLFAALPVYWYVVGRSPHGKGGMGLLEHVASGWGGKLLVLAMLGFIATDFVLTRTLSVSDAATHLLRNPYYQDLVPKRAFVETLFRGEWGQLLLGLWTEQLVVTLALSIIAFGLYHFMVQTLSRGFISFAVGVVGLYLLVNLIVLGSCLLYLRDHAELVPQWLGRLREQISYDRQEAGSVLATMLLIAFKMFPPMAIGLSGFELTMASAPSVTGAPGDTIENPRGRILRTRMLMLVAAVVMCVLVLAATFVTALLVDPVRLLNENKDVEHRALSYIAHGGQLADNTMAVSANSMFGANFGTLYDLSTILILCLAGAGATISMREIVPDFLNRFGMQMSWAHRIGVITHLFNGVILLVTIAFKASVSEQLWAYATAVLALLFGSSLAASLDIKHRWKGFLGFLARLPFRIITILFLAMGVWIIYQQPSGVGIAMMFVLVVLMTAIVSRWMRSTEMRFEGFEFADSESEQRWEQICTLEFQVLVPHDPTHATLAAKEAEIRARHRILPGIPIIFIEVEIGDPSDFFQKPLMKIERDPDGREVIRVTRATSVAHVIAAIGLAFREVGHPPEFYFKWSTQPVMEATVNFLLLGQGNVPVLVRTLIHKAEPEASRRPRVIVADS